MKRRFNLMLAVGSIGLLGFAGAAIAAVTFDAADGTGFVGKGDVQLAYGWNNKQLQANASNVDFLYTDVTDYEYTCEGHLEGGNQGKGKGKGKKKVRSVLDTSTAISRDLTTATRHNPKGDINGFNLQGFEAILSQDDIPEVGETCTAIDEETGKEFTGTISEVSTPIATLDGDKLEVTHHGVNPKTVWTPPAPLEPVA